MLYVTYTRGSCDTANASAAAASAAGWIKRNDNISAQLGGGAQYKKKKMPSCVERLLLTAAALTLYVNFRRGLIRVHRSKDVRQTCGVFPHLWQAGKNKHQLQAGSLLLLLLSLCPKCHFLVSNTLSCQVVVYQPTMPPPKSNLSSKAEEGVAVAIETTSSSTTSSLQSLLWMPYKPSPPHLTHTHPPSHTPSPTMCFFFCFHFFFFLFNSIVHLWRFLQFSGLAWRGKGLVMGVFVAFYSVPISRS